MSTEQKITLQQLAEAFRDSGLDPALELVRLLKAERPAIANGKVLVDDAGAPKMVHLLEPETRARLLLQLLEFTQPKLKAVEVKVSGTLEMSDEQLNSRLQALLAKLRGTEPAQAD